MVEDGFCPLLSNDRVSCGASPKKQSLETILLQQNFWGNYKLYIVSICNFGFLLNSKLQNICRRKNRKDNAHLSLPSPRYFFFSTRCTHCWACGGEADDNKFQFSKIRFITFLNVFPQNVSCASCTRCNVWVKLVVGHHYTGGATDDKQVSIWKNIFHHFS